MPRRAGHHARRQGDCGGWTQAAQLQEPSASSTPWPRRQRPVRLLFPVSCSSRVSRRGVCRSVPTRGVAERVAREIRKVRPGFPGHAVVRRLVATRVVITYALFRIVAGRVIVARWISNRVTTLKTFPHAVGPRAITEPLAPARRLLAIVTSPVLIAPCFIVAAIACPSGNGRSAVRVPPIHRVGTGVPVHICPRLP